MSGKNKRSQLATPPRKQANKDTTEEEALSPIKSPDKKRAFTGGVDMDEDISSPEKEPPQKDKEREQRRLAREEQKRQASRRRAQGRGRSLLKLTMRRPKISRDRGKRKGSS